MLLMEFNNIIIYLLSLLVFLDFSSSDNVTCIRGCVCDTKDEVINCHNLKLTSLTLPKDSIPNFTVLRATNNDLQYLPSEDLLRKKFPQLQGVDVEGNPNFDCQSLRFYRHLTIFSDCDEYGVIVPKDVKIPTSDDDNNECGLKCTINAKARALTDYAKYYWEKLLEKLRRFDRENRTWNEMKDLFNNLHNAMKEIF
uniref:LRRNT domain-containing protein n=1 Tax=Strongyloides venezuelensis TaxID=75913 RepID=A0A0K0G1I6_STRVS